MNNANVKLISAQFGVVKDKVSAQDKLDAAYELKCHPGTITRYLRGEVAKEPFALELLAFLKGKIAEREKALEV